MYSADILSTPSDWTFLGKIENFAPPSGPSSHVSSESEDMMKLLEDNIEKLLSEDHLEGCAKKETVVSTKTSSAGEKLQYLENLLTEQKDLAKFLEPSSKVKKILRKEISRIWMELGQNDQPIQKETKTGEKKQKVKLVEKIYVTVYPEYNFVGRILGVGGQSIAKLAKELGVALSVRGRGSQKPKEREEKLRNLPNWEHLKEDLHVVIECEDYEGVGQKKMAKAVERIKELMVPVNDSETYEKQLKKTNKISPEEPKTFQKPLVTLRFV